MEQPPNIYAYQALNAATREIRVLKLHPGREADKISGELLTTVFDSRSPYDALSYQWGNPTVTKPIYLGPNEELQITSFLREALTFIRKHDEVIIIWIDAICISQKDVSERNHQVSMMKEIYSNARTVRVWLNQEIDSSSPCFAILAKLDKCSSPEDLGNDTALWKPIAVLFQDLYWDRLWIQQELLFAKDIMFHCRKTMLSGQTIGVLQWLILRRRKEVNGLIDRNYQQWSDLSWDMKLSLTPSRHLLWWREMMSKKRPIDRTTLLPPGKGEGEPFDLGEMLSEGSLILHMPFYLLGGLRNSKRLSLTDPRDRVYGILSIVADVKPGDIHIDYAKSVAEVYTDVCRFITRKYHFLAFLPHANVPKEGNEELPGRPSWVPNWNESVEPGYFWTSYKATLSLQCLPDPIRVSIENVLTPPEVPAGRLLSPNSSSTPLIPTLRAQGFRIDILNPHLAISGFNQPATDLLSLLTTLIATTPPSNEPVLLLPTGYDLGVALQTHITALGNALTGPSISMRHAHTTFTSEESFFYPFLLLRAAAIHAALSQPLNLGSFESFSTEPNSRLDEWLANIILLSSADTSFLGVVDLPDMFQHEFELVHANFRSFVTHMFMTIRDLSVTSTVGKRIVVTQQIPTREGDEIWLLIGCPTPMILRRGGEGYTVVGPVFVKGFMNGEAVVGVEGVLQDGEMVGEWEVETIELR